MYTPDPIKYCWSDFDVGTGIYCSLGGFYQAISCLLSFLKKTYLDSKVTLKFSVQSYWVLAAPVSHLWLKNLMRNVFTSRSQRMSSKAFLLGMQELSFPLSMVPTREKVRCRMWLFNNCCFFLYNIAKTWKNTKVIKKVIHYMWT